MLLRLYRAAVLVTAMLMVHLQARWFEAQQSPALSIRQLRKFFPQANHIELTDAARGLHVVTDARGNRLGTALRTSPFTDNIVGYSGPNDLLIALDGRGAVVGLDLLRSGDTAEHVRKIRQTPGFLRTLFGWKPSEAPPPKVDAVSGATLTSFAIVEAIQQRLAGASPSMRFPEPITLTEIQTVITNAARFVPAQSRWRVFDRAGRPLGFALRTSPQADNVAGYRGPTECLVALALDGRTVTALRLSKSYDTESYVDQVRRAQPFLERFIGHTIDELAELEFSKEKVQGISGATLTARAVSVGTKQRFAAELRSRSQVQSWRPKARDWALASVVLGAVVLSFTSWRGHRWVRWAWQLLLVGYIGAVGHDFLSLALLGGWAANGVAVRTAPALVLLGAVSLLVPWSSRRQVYCHQICPHGAAQQLLGQIGKLFLKRPDRPRLGQRAILSQLERVPGFLLLAAFIVTLLGLNLSLVSFEPFDAWVWHTAGFATLILAGVGLVASLFIPQAYCRFGCPTGALLGFLRSSGSSDRWGRRDWAAAAFLAMGMLVLAGSRLWPPTATEPAILELRGRTMGTTWSVKIRDEVADPPAIEKAITREFEWAESMTSHWRTNTPVSEFNRLSSTNAFPVPWPMVTLSRWANEVSRATDGAYDITVGPLVRLWGFGPGPPRTDPPSDAEIRALLPAVGWQKLEVLDGMLRKQNPALEVDFSSIAKGWAIDQVSQVLTRRGYSNVLVEAGGELRASGRWTVAIELPARKCTLTNESIATSGTYRQNFQSAGRRYSHLIDPRQGRPIAHQTVSVSVRDADCAHADAWATAFNVLGADLGFPLAERLNLAVQFVVERSNGPFEIRETSQWKLRTALATTTGKLPP